MTDVEDKRQEQAHLRQVIVQIKQEQAKLKQNIQTAQADIHEIDRTFGDDVHVGMGDDGISMAGALSIQQQQQMLAERNNSWQRSQQQLMVLNKLVEKPYFARLDFQELPSGKPETIYIGLGSLTDEDNNFLIYDWRAPISAIYYDGDLGQVTYQTPDGEQAVKVTLKRQFIIEKGQIQTFFDTEETIGDQMLLAVLDNKASTKMKSIVTTIQREQNQIIRDTDSDLLFVQGAAGSGKTAAIMQRVAYLLYRYRHKLDSGQVVLFSPNMLFNDYVSQVLPEMGEQNMIQLTYSQYLGHRLPKVQLQTLAQQFEATQTPTQQAIIHFVSDYQFFQLETQYAQLLGQGGVYFRDLRLHDRVLLSRQQIAQIYYHFGPQYRLVNRIEATKAKLLKKLQGQLQREMKQEWVQTAIQNLSSEQLRQLYDYPDQEFATSEAEEKFLAHKLVEKELQPVARKIQQLQFLNPTATYQQFLRSVPQIVDLAAWKITPADWQEYQQQFQADLQKRQLRLSDLTPYLYLYDLITGHHGDLKMKFVFIDEIQDYTPFQLAYLKYSFPRARYTLLGDLNQSIFVKGKAPVLLKEVRKLFVPEKTRVVQLTHSYRSTQQITEFTKQLLQTGVKIQAFHRPGDLPNVLLAKKQMQMLQALQQQLRQNHDRHYATAIITRNLEQAQELQEQLRSSSTATTLVRSENQRLASGDLVIPVYLAKGLEFDAVIIWNASAGEFTSQDRQVLYTMASRAMHRLTITACGQLEPLLAAIPENYYQKTVIN
ncbi:AAA family ATPase [Lactobacillus sp. DCY120]|uniref:AAA family ATPase n=1 Tax=Bombilactobacillus apium TaxID=2675299 RepID=A0A850QWN5_9LACO|nr:RNA polymerase recycling motor HelD [Bombilactobacillus apium]NVY96214.1 AAA family ATPase [Bombilactobacillus apium]